MFLAYQFLLYKCRLVRWKVGDRETSPSPISLSDVSMLVLSGHRLYDLEQARRL
jgi:hypothetical protein